MLSRIYSSITGGTRSISDQEYYDDIAKTKTLADVSKNIYKRKIFKATGEFFDHPVTIDWIIRHPNEYKDACLAYGKSKQMESRSIAQYLVPFNFLLLYHQEIQEENPKLRYMWQNIRAEVNDLDQDIYTEQKLSEKQKKAMTPFDEICKVRDTLPIGSYQKLLFSLYTMIPPCRSDFDLVKIYDKLPLKPETKNYLVLGKINKLFLNEYKTNNRYEQIVIDLPANLVKEIKYSLKAYPREYLFVNQYNQPYSSPTAFNKYANLLVKKVMNNQSFTLTTFRRSYLSNPKLDLENMSHEDRVKLGKKMGHSVPMQQGYVWPTKEEHDEK